MIQNLLKYARSKTRYINDNSRQISRTCLLIYRKNNSLYWNNSWQNKYIVYPIRTKVIINKIFSMNWLFSQSSLFALYMIFIAFHQTILQNQNNVFLLFLTMVFWFWFGGVKNHVFLCFVRFRYLSYPRYCHLRWWCRT